VSAEKPAVGAISVGRLGRGFRVFAWRDVAENTPVGAPLFVIDADSLGEAMDETLRVLRGERPWP
jgi:hypothetical protein